MDEAQIPLAEKEETKDEGKKPTAGTWDSLPSAPRERLQKIEFPINTEVLIKFPVDFEKPVELHSKEDESVYYLFEVLHQGTNKVFTTSAWSLLHALKLLTPLAARTIGIKKVIKNKKQHYEVRDLTAETISGIQVEKIAIK